MFQKVMVQITKQKKEKSIINRIIVDVFQLNKKLKTKSTTLTDTQKQQQTHRKRHEETLAKEKRKRHENIYCKEREKQCGKRQQQQQQQQATFCKQANKKTIRYFAPSARCRLQIDRSRTLIFHFQCTTFFGFSSLN